MSDLGSQGTVGIDSVEWLDAGAGYLTVRVTGRRRRRRAWLSAENRAPAVLVVETDSGRQRFSAMPEPPSLGGAAPGTWRLSFSIPGELAPDLRSHAFLMLGGVIVPLPMPESAAMPTPSASAPPSANPESARAASPLPSGNPESARAASPLPSGNPESARSLPTPPAADPEPEPDLSVSPTPPDPTPPTDQARGRDEPPDTRVASLEIERAWQRADEAERASSALSERVFELERMLDQERDERRQHELASQERDRHDRAEQHADAQAAQRRDLALEQSAAAETHRLDVERSLRSARGGGSRVPAEPATPASGPVPAPLTGGAGLPEGDLITALRAELGARAGAEAGLRARLVASETRLAARVLLEQRTASTLRELRSELQRLAGALDRERELRRAAEAQAAALRAQLGGQRERSRDVYDAIDEIRGALGHLREPDAEAPALAGPVTPEPAPGGVGAGAVTPERLSDALARLRETSPPREGPDGDELPSASPPAPSSPLPSASPPAPSSPLPSASPLPSISPLSATRVAGGATVAPALRRLAGRDTDQAGRLVLDLLGAQRVAYPYPIAYDLILGAGHGCVQVTVGPSAPPVIQITGGARAREQVAFRVLGDPAQLARLLLAGRLRRLLRVGVARVRGDRGGLSALRALLTLPLDLGALQRAGMHARPETLLALVAAAIDPAWTRGERFTLALITPAGDSAYLQLRDGRAPLVTRTAPEGRIAVSLTGPGERLAASLAGESDGAEVTGDAGALGVLREWIERARCG
jgi:hypothetical protein